MVLVLASLLTLLQPPPVEVIERVIDPCGKRSSTIDVGDDGARTLLVARGRCQSALVRRVVVDGEGPGEGQLARPMFVQEAFGTKPLTLEFMPAEGWDPVAVRVEAAPGVRIAVDVQTTVIMQCNNEGPHVELWDWKRARSAWTALSQKDGAYVFEAPPKPELPAVKVGELRAALEKIAPGFPTTDCAPVVGETRLRVRASRDGASWTTVSELALRPALGC